MKIAQRLEASESLVEKIKTFKASMRHLNKDFKCEVNSIIEVSDATNHLASALEVREFYKDKDEAAQKKLDEVSDADNKKQQLSIEDDPETSRMDDDDDEDDEKTLIMHMPMPKSVPTSMLISDWFEFQKMKQEQHAALGRVMKGDKRTQGEAAEAAAAAAKPANESTKRKDQPVDFDALMMNRLKSPKTATRSELAASVSSASSSSQRGEPPRIEIFRGAPPMTIISRRTTTEEEHITTSPSPS